MYLKLPISWFLNYWRQWLAELFFKIKKGKNMFLILLIFLNTINTLKDVQKARGAQSFLSIDNIFGTWTSFTSKRWDPDWILCSTCRINIYQYDTARLSKYFHWNVITTTSQHYSATFVLIINHINTSIFFIYIWLPILTSLGCMYQSKASRILKFHTLLVNEKIVPQTFGTWKRTQ